jgi:ABC-type enterochelin transport system permease subunit
MQAVKGSSMEKWLCWGSLSVAGLVLLCFALDLFLAIPFGGLSKAVDIIGILGSGILVYLCWDSLLDVI